MKSNLKKNPRSNYHSSFRFYLILSLFFSNKHFHCIFANLLIYRPLTRFKIENDDQSLLRLLRKTNANLIVIANSSSNLGNAYQGRGQLKTAIHYHQRHLEIAKEVGDKAAREKVMAVSATLITV